MDLHEMVVKLFDLFYQKIYKNPSFHLDLSLNNQKKQVDNFIILLANYYGMQSIGINSLLEYFSFSFHYWSTKITQRKISLNWIIGKKTFTRFTERISGQDYYTQKWLVENDINLDNLRHKLIVGDAVEPLNRSEELEKIRFHGHARLANCLHHTTMYNHRSVNCIGCDMKNLCKNVLKEKFPIIYKQRGYERSEARQKI
jgi:hypothetical protein